MRPKDIPVYLLSYSAGKCEILYTQSEAWSGVNWADPMAAQGAFGADSRHDAKAPWAAMRSAQFTPLQASDRV